MNSLPRRIAKIKLREPRLFSPAFKDTRTGVEIYLCRRYNTLVFHNPLTHQWVMMRSPDYYFKSDVWEQARYTCLATTQESHRNYLENVDWALPHIRSYKGQWQPHSTTTSASSE